MIVDNSSVIKVKTRSRLTTSYHALSSTVRQLSLAVFTLEDEQIVWTDKTSQTDKSPDVKTGRTNFQTISSVCLSVCEDDFLKAICPSRTTSRLKSDLHSHSDGLRTNGRFARVGELKKKQSLIVG